MVEVKEENLVVCPWCEKGEVYTEGNGKVAVTVRCPKCMHFFRIKLDDYTAEKVQARRKMQTHLCRMNGTYRSISVLRR